MLMSPPNVMDVLVEEVYDDLYAKGLENKNLFPYPTLWPEILETPCDRLQ